MTFAFEMFRGDTTAQPLTIREATGAKSAVDLTGLTLQISADTDGEQTDETNQIFKKAMTVTNASAGQCEFSLETADWVGVSAGDYFFDIEAEDGSGDLQTLVKGRFRIVQDINKS